MIFKRKNTLKKSISIILFLIMVFSTVQFSVFADDESITSGQWTYYIDESLGGACISAYSGNAENVTIPAQLDGNSVKALGYELFLNNKTIKTITIPSGVERIYDYCFLDASKLSSISLPSTVTSIGTSSFSNCTSLSSVSLGGGLTEISTGAFNGCSSLSSVSGGEKLTSIGYYAFRNCKSLSSFTIRSTVTTIDSYAFNNCTALKSIIIPEGTSNIGSGAFAGCTSLANITINGANHTFGTDAFLNTAAYNNSSNWKDGNFVLSGILLTIEDKNIVNIPEGVKTIPNGVLSGLDAKTINLPSSLTACGDDSFSDLYSLEEINVASGNTAFSTSNGALIRKSDSCLIIYPQQKNAESVTIPASTKKINSYAFANNSYIKNVSLQGSVTEIGNNAFESCSNLSTINFVSGLKIIGESAFEYCTSLKTITIPDSVTQIGSYAFSSCSALSEAKVSTALSEISSGLFQECQNLKKVTLGNNISNISSYAFSNCSSLQNINLGSSVKTIGSYAFEYCALIKTIETNASIDSGAFENCTGLTTFKMKAGTSLGSSAFSGCTSLSTVEFPSTLESIGYECFFNCISLKKVFIPQSVEEIGGYAFGYKESEDDDSLIKDFIIEGYEYSAAEDYANSYEIKFEKKNIEKPGNIRINHSKGIIYLDALKVTAKSMSDYLKFVGACDSCSITKGNGSSISNSSNIGTGCKITLDGSQFTLVIMGDTTGDGLITSADYLQIKKCFQKIYSFDEYSFISADVNLNGSIDATDYLRIKLHFLKQYNLFE